MASDPIDVAVILALLQRMDALVAATEDSRTTATNVVRRYKRHLLAVQRGDRLSKQVILDELGYVNELDRILAEAAARARVVRESIATSLAGLAKDAPGTEATRA